MRPLFRYKSGDKLLQVYQETDSPESPRDWDNLGVMVCFHRRYNLGDKNHGVMYSDYDSFDQLEGDLMKNHDAVIILPLYLYDHSGLTISTRPFSSRWDSGQIGVIYTTKQKIREFFGIWRVTDKLLDKAESVLKNEVLVYDQWLRGDIYGFTVSEFETCNLGHEHENIINSCWGYYGSDFKANGLFESTNIKDWIEL